MGSSSQPSYLHPHLLPQWHSCCYRPFQIYRDFFVFLLVCLFSFTLALSQKAKQWSFDFFLKKEQYYTPSVILGRGCFMSVLPIILKACTHQQNIGHTFDGNGLPLHYLGTATEPGQSVQKFPPGEFFLSNPSCLFFFFVSRPQLGPSLVIAKGVIMLNI